MGMESHDFDLGRLMRFLTTVRELDPLMPAQCLHTLLVIANRPGITQVAIAVETGLARTSVSRNVNALGTTHRNGKPGLGLVAQVPHLADAKASSVYLTTKGRDLMRKLLQAATGQPADSFNPRTVR